MLKRAATDLGLDRVLETIAGFSLSTEGYRAVVSSQPVVDRPAYERRRHLVSRTIMALTEARGREISAQAFPYLTPMFDLLASKSGAPIDGTMLYDTALFIRSALRLRDVFTVLEPEGDVPESLENVIPPVDKGLTDLMDEIFNILESPGRVKESYPTVKALREKAEQRRLERNRFADRYMKGNSSLMNSDTPVLRDGRIVLPVDTASRSRVAGYVQGASQTGATLYMEPFELVDMNNAVNIANQEVEIEIARLLARLGGMVRDNEESLRILSSDIGFADFLYSFASWAMANNCTQVSQSPDSTCTLVGARHPLLRQRCVPVDLKVEAGVRALVLTGPNAGGKTVTMKTVGLFVLLNQICGYVPASDGTTLALFDRVFTDIGDDQSIENSLSTFSGHMRNLGTILRNLTENSLVILDELGSGTDPQEGAALARSILEFCTKKAMLTLVTSHHGVLKQYAHSSQAVRNASMEFDEKTLEPTFRVLEGIPGESHAIDTAFRMHLPKPVVFNARRYMGREAVRISTIIRSLEQKQQQAERELEEIDRRKAALEEQKQALDEQDKRLKALENSLKIRELRNFDDYIKDTRRKLEALVRELREGEITREKNLKVRQFISELDSRRSEMEKDIETAAAQAENPAGEGEIREGMEVLCGPHRREGVVVRKEKDGRWQVAIGQMRFVFRESELAIPGARSGGSAMPKAVFDSSTVRSVMPKATIDLRGYRLEPALEALDTQIEACCVHGIDGFSIIHGYGNGILSAGIHAHLGTHGAVQDYFFAHPEDGGQGKTYVRLRS